MYIQPIDFSIPENAPQDGLSWKTSDRKGKIRNMIKRRIISKKDQTLQTESGDINLTKGEVADVEFPSENVFNALLELDIFEETREPVKKEIPVVPVNLGEDFESQKMEDISDDFVDEDIDQYEPVIPISDSISEAKDAGDYFNEYFKDNVEAD